MNKPLQGAVILPPKEFYSPSEAGGVAHSVRSTLGSHDIIIGRRPHMPPFADTPFIPIDSVSHRFFRRFHYLLKLRSILKRLKPDYVEVHNKPNIARILKKFFPACPVIVVFHNDPCSMRHTKTAKQRKKLAGEMHIVTKSSWLKERYMRGLGQADIRVIPNAIDFKEFPAHTVPREPLILFVGRITADKGVDSFVRVCLKLLPHFPKWRVEMMGGDRFDARARLTPFYRAVKEATRHDPVTCLGLCSYTEVLEKMLRASIVVVPSRRPEPFGRTALEAMAGGAALLSSFAGALPEVVGDGGLYMDPDKETDFARKLQELMRSEALRARLGKRGRQRARYFSSSVIKEQRNSDITEYVSRFLSKTK